MGGEEERMCALYHMGYYQPQGGENSPRDTALSSHEHLLMHIPEVYIVLTNYPIEGSDTFIANNTARICYQGRGEVCSSFSTARFRHAHSWVFLVPERTVELAHHYLPTHE
jgi:hypothetical protein